MPPSVSPIPVARALTWRPRPSCLPLRPNGNTVIGVKRPAIWRSYADDKHPEAQGDQVGPNMQQQEHVSEEAAKMSKIMGGKGPDIDGQGTPVQDVSMDAKRGRTMTLMQRCYRS
jgi:small subunit ribosomal protein S7